MYSVIKIINDFKNTLQKEFHELSSECALFYELNPYSEPEEFYGPMKSLSSKLSLVEGIESVIDKKIDKESLEKIGFIHKPMFGLIDRYIFYCDRKVVITRYITTKDMWSLNINNVCSIEIDTIYKLLTLFEWYNINYE